MRYLINDDDLDEIAEFLYKSEDSKADYLLELILPAMYGDTQHGFKVLEELYKTKETV